MLTIAVPGKEFFNEETQEFSYAKDTVLKLEHSLVSISKWEAKWNKPFLSKEQKTNEQLKDYLKCMTINSVDDLVYECVTNENIKEINKYIEAPMSATWFNEFQNGKNNNSIITSELIYYWMIAYNIPAEYQKWHINRLLTLIRICSIKTEQMNNPKKMSKSEIINRNQALNAQRRAKLNSKG